MENCCPYIELGDKAKPPLLFMSGFPDNNLSAWGETIPEQFKKNHRCIFMCLPGYESGGEAKLRKPWAYEQEDILVMMHATIKITGLSQAPIPLIAHDWGAYFALLYTTRHPNVVSKLILCDIGMCSAFTLPLTSIPFIALYQLFFAICYLLSQTISQWLAERLFLNIGIKTFYNILSPPLTNRAEIPQSSLTVLKCYPYYFLWRRLLTGRLLPQTFPSCPVLYLVSKIISYTIFDTTF